MKTLKLNCEIFGHVFTVKTWQFDSGKDMVYYILLHNWERIPTLHFCWW